jgi:hypothetical protein
MSHLVISGLSPWDGRYDFDLAEDALTTREWGQIKRFTGYLPLTLLDGLQGGDPELFAVFAVIALTRAGKITRDQATETYERFLEQPFDADTVTLTDEQQEETVVLPPPASSSRNDASSGPNSRANSESSAASRPGSGTPNSDSSAWRQARSAS